MQPENNRAVGLALFLPAISGAVPIEISQESTNISTICNTIFSDSIIADYIVYFFRHFDCSYEMGARRRSNHRLLQSGDRNIQCNLVFFNLPWTASKMATPFPMFPEGVSPKPPISPAHKSLIISPYKFGRTITSSFFGSATS
jgi:hypothetical protein